jgi:hypothetical protein
MAKSAFGAPVIGALTNQLGARAGMIICGAVPALAAVAGLARLGTIRGQQALSFVQPAVFHGP